MEESDDQKLRVLVVDDDPEAPSICRGLTSFGKHQFEVSASAETGLNRLKRGPSAEFDLVLVDFELDDEWSALTFIDQARAIRPDIPYFIWSAHTADSIQRELKRLPLAVIFEARAAGFVEKSRVAHDPQMLDMFIDKGLERFREQLAAQLHGTLIGVFSQLDVALTQTRAVSRGIQDLVEGDTGAKSTRLAVKPLRIRLHRVEATLCRTLGYRREHTLEFKAAANEALEVLVSRDGSACLSSAVRVPLSKLVREGGPSAWQRSTAKLRDALQALSGSEAAQQEVAEHISDISEFMIYSGASERAAALSREVWVSANEYFSFIPRLSCAVTHALALASCGELPLAEQLASAVLVEAEDRLSEVDLKEISRSVFAELDDFARHSVPAS